MACHSCGVEFFTQYPTQSETIYQKEVENTGCSLKENTTQCLYTAQGVFVCLKDNKVDTSVRDMGIVDNESMMMESTRDSCKFKNAAQW